jgi:hypothetical protein
MSLQAVRRLWRHPGASRTSTSIHGILVYDAGRVDCNEQSGGDGNVSELSTFIYPDSQLILAATYR